MIPIKSAEELKIMKEGGKITAQVLRKVLDSVRPGKTLEGLDKYAEGLILKFGGKPSFKMVDDYNFSTCINVNEGVVHGIPSKRVIKLGYIVSVDIGVYYRGFHTDAARTILVGEGGEKEFGLEEFLKTGRKALDKAIEQCGVGKSVGDLSRAIQETVEGEGYSVVRQLVGHGVGRSLHEPPEIPGFVTGGRAVILKEGMTLAIEVIYNQGDWPVVTDKRDGWTIDSKDGSISALFEDTVAISRMGPIVLTNN